ncbi:MAG: TolC family outer membrane protein [Alphaproteobacteria bacterium]
MRRITRNDMLAAASVLALAVGAPATAFAQSLEEALVQTYLTNPTIGAQRALLRATDEQVPRALGGWRPTVTFTADAGRVQESQSQNLFDQTTAGTQSLNRWQRTYSLAVTQPLFRGFRTVAETERAEQRVNAERQRLSATEQLVFRDAVTAYLNVVRDEAVLDLNINNEQVLRKQLEATLDRFEVGEVTRTDVSQAEARLARSTAERIGSEGALETSRAIYQRIVGEMPVKLTEPPLPKDLPGNLQETITLASTNNPTVRAADFDQKAAQADVDLVFGELLPTVAFVGELRKDDNTIDTYSRDKSARALARLTVPLYQAGTVEARVREAKQVAGQRRIQVDQARRQVVEDAISAWQDMTSAHAQVDAFTKQTEANRIALEGVEQEATAGLRTVLDVLDAEQELRDSRVSLVRARRDYVVGAYRVRYAVGSLTSAYLNLPVERYDPLKHYNEVRDKWIGTGVPKE